MRFTPRMARPSLVLTLAAMIAIVQISAVTLASYGPCTLTQSAHIISDSSGACVNDGFTATCPGVQIWANYQSSCSNITENSCTNNPVCSTMTYYSTPHYLGDPTLGQCIGWSAACMECLVAAGYLAVVPTGGISQVAAGVTGVGCAAACLVGSWFGYEPKGCCWTSCSTGGSPVYTGNGTICTS